MKHPKEQYMFAVDRTKNKSLKHIIKSISKGIGNGQIKKEVDPKTYKQGKEDFKFDELSINLKIKPTKVFDDEKLDDEEEEEFEARKFKWHCEFGITESKEVLRKEFNDYYNLQPVKIIILGPPGSGKTELANKLTHNYNIPIINILDIVKYGKSLKNELGEEVKAALEEDKQKKFDEINELEQKKKNPQELDITTVNIKEYLPLTIVFKVLKKMLAENIYRNRGYILDGFPKSYSQAQSCFTIIDEEKAEEDPTRESIYTEILPNNVILLKGDSDERLMDRFRNKKEEELINTHYNLVDMKRRLKEYKDNNESVYGELACIDFFQLQNIKKLELDCFKMPKEIQESVKVFIERSGPINNYLEAHLKKEDLYSDILKEEMGGLETDFDKRIKVNEYYEKLQKKEVFEYNKQKIEELKAKERKVLEDKSQDLRYYLTENVIPILSQGILEICRKCPEDPVDELAKFLMEKSCQVAFNDPSKYKQN